jgi:hypothetical protein
VNYEAVAGRGRSSGEPPSRPFPEPDWPREGGFRCFVGGAGAVDWPVRDARDGRGLLCAGAVDRAAGLLDWRLVRAAGLGARSSRGRSSRWTRAGGSGARRCGISQYGQTTHRGSMGFSQFSHGSLTRARQLGQRR